LKVTAVDRGGHCKLKLRHKHSGVRRAIQFESGGV